MFLEENSLLAFSRISSATFFTTVLSLYKFPFSCCSAETRQRRITPARHHSHSWNFTTTCPLRFYWKRFHLLVILKIQVFPQ